MNHNVISAGLLTLALLRAESTAAQQAAPQQVAFSSSAPIQGPSPDPAAQQPPDPAQKLATTETVTVTAPGATRDEQSIDSKLLLESTPGTSPIAALAHLPSVSITAADPYGSYEWALRISVRGFNQNQLGFTLDDVPLGDMSYGNLNGLHISRALIDENLGKATLSQGTGALETASTSNLGGAVQFFSNDPLDKRGFQAQQSFGSFAGSRTFARYDSGLLSTHTKLFIDGVYQTSDKWRGFGPIRQSYFQFNTKFQQFVGTKGLLTALCRLLQPPGSRLPGREQALGAPVCLQNRQLRRLEHVAPGSQRLQRPGRRRQGLRRHPPPPFLEPSRPSSLRVLAICQTIRKTWATTPPAACAKTSSAT